MLNSKINVGELVSWLKMTQPQVLAKFMSLENAYTDGKGDCSFVYVPGTRPDRVLLVAHADTVFGQNHVPKIGLHSGILFSLKNETSGKIRSRSDLEGRSTKGTGIGADDRAGCAIVWKLRNSGHSLLITCGEEVGQIAANKIMENDWWKEEISKHQFAIQFDRRGHNDLVFYQCGPYDFRQYVEDQTGYKTKQGSRTDICVLCKDIAGVNISVGYYNEHSSNEILVLDQWFNTYITVRKWIEQSDLPEHKNTVPSYNSYNYSYDDEYWEGRWNRWTEKKQKKEEEQSTIAKAAQDIVTMNSADPIVFCEHCGVSRKESVWINSRYLCPACKMPLCLYESL